jgi:hypothetical protein
MRNKLMAVALVWVVSLAGFLAVNIPFDDWHTYRMVALGDWQMYHHSGYYNPPYVAFFLLPLAVLPEHIGFAILSASSIAMLMGMCLKYNLPVWSCVILLVSPPTIYTLLHGQIDILLLGAYVFLPSYVRPYIALAKPQVTLGALFTTPLRSWVFHVCLLIALYAAFATVLGWSWPLDLLHSTTGAEQYGWNSARLFLMPIGWLLMFYGYSLHDDDMCLAASPLLMLYAAPSSFITPLFVLLKRAPTAVSVAVLVSAWLMVVA